jgi:hypothetical protein
MKQILNYKTLVLCLILTLGMSFVTVNNVKNPELNQLIAKKSAAPVRMVFRKWATKNGTKEWSDWEIGQNIFIFDYDENGNVKHFTSGNKTSFYIKRTEWEKGKTTQNDSYFAADFVDESGNSIRIQIFTTPRTFVKIMLLDMIFQFDDKFIE